MENFVPENQSFTTSCVYFLPEDVFVAAGAAAFGATTFGKAKPEKLEAPQIAVVVVVVTPVSPLLTPRLPHHF